MKRNVMVKLVSFLVLMLALFVSDESKADATHSSVIMVRAVQYCKGFFKMSSEYQLGESEQLMIGFRAYDGFKWNKDFPAKTSFSRKPSLIKVPYVLYEKDSFYFDENLKVVILPIKFVPIKIGSEILKLNLRYSVCDAQSCILETVELELGITILP